MKLNSPGPMIYMQKRIGEDGGRFTLFKFSTMIHKAEKGIGPVWAKKDDPRRTKVGGFLRRHNLDEMPQLVNVLKGEMSLVGPRPERPHFVGKFKDNIPRYMARHKIKSGVTGWAQVNGLRELVAVFRHKDTAYVCIISLFPDAGSILAIWKKKK